MATINGRVKRKSPADNSNDDIIHVNLSISFQDGHRLFFKVGEDLQFAKVFRDFCERKKLDYDTLKFIYDGTYVRGNQTPKMLNMEDGAEIFAARHQFGG